MGAHTHTREHTCTHENLCILVHAHVCTDMHVCPREHTLMLTTEGQLPASQPGTHLLGAPTSMVTRGQRAVSPVPTSVPARKH